MLSRRELLQGTGSLALAGSLGRWLAPPPEERVGWAVLGLGGYALGQILPSFKDCRRSRLVALVSGSPDKARRVAEQYGVAPKGIYDYRNFESIRDNPEVQVVYVITPPGTHREFTVRAAKAGKHVLSEKPMAPTVADCDAMIAACRRAGKRLMIGYRSQYEPHNLRAIQAVRSGELGKVRSIVSDHGFSIGPGTWRTQKALAGGGSLYDIGIYSLQAARYLTGEEPTEVRAMIHSPAGDPRFKEVEDTAHFTLRFASGALANLSSGYSWAGMNRYHVVGDRGTMEAEPATAYAGNRLTIKGQLVEVPPVDQFAAQLDDLSECIQEDKPVRTPGEEGRRDIRILQAVYEAARTGRPVRL